MFEDEHCGVRTVGVHRVDGDTPAVCTGHRPGVCECESRVALAPGVAVAEQSPRLVDVEGPVDTDEHRPVTDADPHAVCALRVGEGEHVPKDLPESGLVGDDDAVGVDDCLDGAVDVCLCGPYRLADPVRGRLLDGATAPRQQVHLVDRGGHPLGRLRYLQNGAVDGFPVDVAVDRLTQQFDVPLDDRQRVPEFVGDPRREVVELLVLLAQRATLLLQFGHLGQHESPAKRLRPEFDVDDTTEVVTEPTAVAHRQHAPVLKIVERLVVGDRCVDPCGPAPVGRHPVSVVLESVRERGTAVLDLPAAGDVREQRRGRLVVVQQSFRLVDHENGRLDVVDDLLSCERADRQKAVLDDEQRAHPEQGDAEGLVVQPRQCPRSERGGHLRQQRQRSRERQHPQGGRVRPRALEGREQRREPQGDDGVHAGDHHPVRRSRLDGKVLEGRLTQVRRVVPAVDRVRQFH